MKTSTLFISLILVLLTMPSVFAINEAFSVNGTVYNSSFSAVANANVTVTAEIVTAGGGGPPQTSAQSWSTASNGSGYFSISGINGTGDDFPVTAMLLFHITVTTNGSDGNATEVSPVMPPLPKAAVVQLLAGGSFYLVPAGSIKISAVNSSGETHNFSGMVFDKKLGMPIKSFSNVNSTEAIVPRDRNYSIMVYQMPSSAPGTGAPPQSTDVVNLTNSSTAAGTRVYYHVQNLTTVPVEVTGNLTVSGNATNVTFTRVEGYLYITDFIPTGALLPASPSAGSPGYFAINSTRGNYSLTALGTASGMKILIAVYANNGTHFFAGFQNVTLKTSDAASGKGLNFTLRLLAGAAESAVNANKSTTTLNFTDASTGAAINGGGHSEVTVTYNDVNGAVPLKWIVEPSSSGTLSVPLLSAYSGNITVKMYSHNFAPKESKLNLANSTVNIPLKRFGTEKPPGSVSGGNLSGVAISFYRSNSTCNVPSPSSGCSLISAGSAESFNPLQAAMAGNVNLLLLQSTGITLYFINVDLLASGPPDTSYDDTARNESSGATTFQQIWKFGSMAPKIYDNVYIGIPYNSTASKIDDRLPITIKLPLLYDADWNLVYNDSSNSLNNLPSDYADFNSSSYGWFNYTGTGVACLESTTATCYLDRANKMLWLHIPHFSGVGPQVVSFPAGINITSDKTLYSCYPNCNAYINVTHNDTATFGNLRNLTINISTNIEVGSFSIGYFNSSASSWQFLGRNNATLTNFNFSQGIQLNFTVSMHLATSTKWTFNITIDNATSAYSLDPYLDGINMTGPANGSYLGDNNMNFTFRLISDNVTTQNCTVSPSTGSPNTVIAANGTSAGILFNLTQTANGIWNVSCNESGTSQNLYYIANTPPQITINSPSNNSNTSIRTVNITFTDSVVGLNNATTSINITINGNTYYYPNSLNCSPETFTVNYTSSVTCWLNHTTDGLLELNITATDGIGAKKNMSINFTLDTVPPSPPSLTAGNVSDYDIDGNIEINWTIVSGAKKYAIYRSASNFSPSPTTFLYNVSGTNTNVFEDNTTTHGSAYWYAVVSIDFSENYNLSNPSWTFNATANDTILPRLISTLDAANASDGSITINWTSITRDINNNADSGGVTYRIFYRSGNNASDVNTTVSSAHYAGNTTSTSFNIASVAAGTNYTFVVTTYDDDSNYNSTITGANNVSAQSSTCSNSYSCGAYGACQSTATQTRSCTRTCYSGGANSSTESAACVYTSSTTTTTGGGGSDSASAKESFAGFSIAAGSSLTKTLTTSSIGISSIEIAAKNAVSNADLTVEKLSSKPSTAETPAGKVYQYLQLTTTIKETDASSIKIKFKAEKSWLASSGVNENDVVLLRLSGSKWTELKTTKTTSDATYVNYEAESPGFSYYAIAQKSAAAATNATTGTTTTTPAETPAPAANITPPPATAENESKAPGTVKADLPNQTWTIVIALLAVAIIATIAYYSFSRKKKKGIF